MFGKKNTENVSKMRVLMLSWAFPPGINGGIASNVHHLSKNLKGSADVHVVTCGFPDEPATGLVDGVKVTRVNDRGIPQRDFIMWLYRVNSLMVEKASEIIQNEGPFDVVHAHDWLVSRAAVELKQRFSLPLVTTIHSAEPEVNGVKINTGALQASTLYIGQYLMLNSDRIICCSSYLQGQVMKGFGLPDSKMIDVIPNGVDPSRFDISGTSAPAAACPTHEENMPDGKKTVLYAGRLAVEKGVHTLVQAVAMLRHQGLDVELVIAGEGPYREDLMDEVRARGLQRYVHFMGPVDHTMLVTLYKLSDVVAIPSLHEPSGSAALEAMASMTPVVASDVGGISDMIEDGVTALKSKPGDSDSLAASIRRVLADRSLAESLKKNARQVVAEKYNWAFVADRTAGVYKDLLQQERARPALDTGDKQVDFVTAARKSLA